MRRFYSLPVELVRHRHHSLGECLARHRRNEQTTLPQMDHCADAGHVARKTINLEPRDGDAHEAAARLDAFRDATPAPARTRKHA